jgi:hypothetical protein
MPAGDAPVRARDREGGGRGTRRRRRGRGLWIFLLFFVAAPAAGFVWYLLQPAARQEEIRAKLPPGWQDRALWAALCLGALVVLAKVLLPLLHGATGGLRRTVGWLRTRPLGLRILFFPFEVVVTLLHGIARLGFAADAVLIVLVSLASLLQVARILKPELLGGLVPTDLLPPLR